MCCACAYKIRDNALIVYVMGCIMFRVYPRFSPDDCCNPGQDEVVIEKWASPPPEVEQLRSVVRACIKADSISKAVQPTLTLQPTGGMLNVVDPPTQTHKWSPNKVGVNCS